MDLTVFATLIVLGSAAVSVSGFLLVTHLVPQRWLVADTDAASALYATIGMVYAILIAIAAIALWEPRTAAAQNVELEATSLAEAHLAAEQLAAADRAAVQHAVSAYLREATGPEWVSLRSHRLPTDRAETLFADLRRTAATSSATRDHEQLALEQVAAEVRAAAGARAARLAAADSGMPPLLWPVLVAGGLLSVAFLYLFGLAPTFPNGLMMACVGGMIAVLLVVLYHVEYPFSRGFAITPDPLLAVTGKIIPGAESG